MGENLISVSVFNSTHTPILSALLLILSTSRFLVPDFPLLAPAPFLSSALYWELPSPASPTETLFGLIQTCVKTYLFAKQQTCHVFRSALLSSSAASPCCLLSKLVVNSVQCINYNCVSGCLCVRVSVHSLRIVSPKKDFVLYKYFIYHFAIKIQVTVPFCLSVHTYLLHKDFGQLHAYPVG